VGLSQHKETPRVCPQCKQLRTFPERNETCSLACAQAKRKGEGTVVRTGLVELDTVRMTPLTRKFMMRNAERLRAEVEHLKQDVKRSLPRIPGVRVQKSKSGIMVEVSKPDLHMGKLAWAKETGYQNYDSGIAAEVDRKADDVLLQRTATHKPEQIVLVVGNDLLNADNLQSTTTAGTPQQCDGRYQKTFRTTRQMVTDSIKRWCQVAPVRVVMVPGNHDTLSTWHLGDSLECVFQGSKDVTIENLPTPRKYYRWGRVMLMWTHGHRGNHASYPLLMATEQREMFGSTSWHEIHLGHLHQVNLREMNGVRVRILPSLCAADAWHSEMGYVGNIRSAEAYIWDRDGMVGTVSYAPPDYDARQVVS
jgi:hypothetical protein